MLSREDVVAITTRLFAVFLVIYTLRTSGAILQLLPQEGAGPHLVGAALANAAIGVTTAALLWFFPLTIARKLLPVLHEPRPPLSASGQDIEDTAIFVLGLWVLAGAIPDAAYWGLFLQQVNQPGFAELTLPPEQFAAIVTTGVELVLGLWLVFGARGLIGAIRRLRAAGSGARPASTE